MQSRVLMDVGPGAGGHGARGIGRYVRGVADSLEEWPAERRELVWAVGRAGQDLSAFGGRSTTSRWLGFRPLDIGLVICPLALGRAMGRTGTDIFHATDPHRPWRNRKIRQLVTAYDLIPLHETEMLASWQPHQRYAYRAYLDQVRRADVVIAISEATAADVSASLAVPRERIAIVAPVVVAPEVVSHHPDPNRPTFLFVGALDPHKQPELAVEALARFRGGNGTRAGNGDGRLRFIGPSSEERRARVREVASRLGVLDSIQFDGRISDSNLDEAYASATALLSTSRIEGFGLPPVEAALRGVPVISVDIPSARETVGELATLVPSDAEAIAEAMAAPQVPTAAARDATRDRYSRRAAAAALWSAYSRLLG